jgi:hypothetical protein
VAPDWFQPGSDHQQFRAVKLPFFLDSGLFLIDFESTKTRVPLSVVAVDCTLEVYLDGELLFQRPQKECKTCDIWHPWDSKRCNPNTFELSLAAPGRHLLAVRSHNQAINESNQQRDTKLLFVHSNNAAFGARLGVLLCLAALGWLGISRLRTGRVLTLPQQQLAACWRHRLLVTLLAFSLVPKLLVGDSFMSTDVSQSALIYTEDLVTHPDLHWAHLQPDYKAAKYWGQSHMHKPPGVYYQYAIPRLLFGFTEAYFPGMARLPGMLGDIIIGWVIWSVVRKRRGDDAATLAAATYLLSNGIFFTTGYVGRVDSLAIAWLMLSLYQLDRKPQGNWVFALFLGSAVAWKQLALLITPLLLTSWRRAAWVLVAGVVTLFLCAPYLLDDPRLFFERLVMPQLSKASGGVSWMMNLQSWKVAQPERVAKAVTLGYMGLLCALPWIGRFGVWRCGAIAFGLFVAATKNVYEHYILWSMPFMVLLAFLERRALALIAFSFGTLTMTLRNERVTLLESGLAYTWSVALAIIFLFTVLTVIVTSGEFKDAPLPALIRRLAQSRRTVEPLKESASTSSP